MTSPQVSAPVSVRPAQANTAPPPSASSAADSKSAISSGKARLKRVFSGQFNGNSEYNPNNISIDKDSGRRMALIAIGFLIFYILLMWAILQNNNNNSLVAAKNEIQDLALKDAGLISNTIDSAVISINNGLREGNSPAQAARLIANAPNITAAAILDNQRRVIKAAPETATFLSRITTDKIETNGVEIQSDIVDGIVTTLVVMRTGQYFAVAAIDPKILGVVSENPGLERTVLAAKSGRVIAGDKDFGVNGLFEVFGIDKDKLSFLTGTESQSTNRLKINGQKYFLTKTKIDNTGLYLLTAKPVAKSIGAKQNLMLFLTLFLGISTLIWLLLSSLYKQIQSLKTIQSETEVSQQRFRAAVEGDRGGIWEIDLANNSAYVSASLAGLLGMPRSEHQLPMDQFLGLFHPQDREKFLASARRAHMQGEFDFDMNVAHLPLILQCRGRPLTRAGSEQQRVIVGVALDITEQRGAQSRLVATEARLQGALSSMTDSFVIWDAMKRLVIWNNRFEDFFGLQPGMLQPGMDQASIEYMIRPAILEVIDTGNGNGIVEIRLADGRWIRYVETPTAEGGHVSIGTNITEIRSREAELRDNEKALQNTVGILKKSQEGIFELAQRYEEEKIRAEDANQSKSDFLANMSHELRTPLNAINGFSDIMQKEMFGPLGDPRYKEYVNDILFSGQHLLALINDILDMSKIEAGKMTLNTEIMFMHDMITQVVRIIRGRAEESQLKLNIAVGEVQEIEADPRAIKQVLLNLLTNAIKFTPENGMVQVDLIQKKSGIIVKVSDSGIGISQENIERLAKPFEQVVDHSTKHKEGTGLGLALSKSLIELHGGNFKIESQLGQGTTVIFSLPNKPIVRKEEVKDNHVTQEISRLASDIASVLADNEAPIEKPEPAETAPTPYPYAQPEPNQPAAAPNPYPEAEPVPYPSVGQGRPAA